MNISRRVKWNATASILNIMASNCQSEFHFCLVDRSETYFCLRDRSEDFFTPSPPIIPTPRLWKYSWVQLASNYFGIERPQRDE